LRVNDGGEGGVPVVLLHGLAGSGALWSAQLDHLRRSRRAATLDLHGFGESERSAQGDYSIESFAADVIAAADALGLPRFVLVGHSMGGAIAIACADRHPERVAGLLLANPAHAMNRLPEDVLARFRSNLSPRSYHPFMDRWFAVLLSASRPSVRRTVVSGLRAAEREVVAASLTSLFAFDPVPPLQRYAGPKLAILAPLRDETLGLHTLMPSLPVRRMQGVSHWLMMDDPRGFNRIMDKFLAAIERR
jgi:pimeloyl-ACP methyl ester carboxylesterase